MWQVIVIDYICAVIAPCLLSIRLCNDECLRFVVARCVDFCSFLPSSVRSVTGRFFEKVASLLFAQGRQQSGLRVKLHTGA